MSDHANDQTEWKPSDENSLLPPLPLSRPTRAASEYPTDALEGVLGDAAKAIQESIQAPAALISQSILAAASLAVQGYADVVVDGRVIPTSLFCLTIGVSGERKSAVDSEVLRPHREFEERRMAQFQAEELAYLIELEAFEQSKKHLLHIKKKDGRESIKTALEGLGAPPQIPTSAVMIMEEPTYEGMVKALISGRPSIGLFSDEGGRMIGGFAMNGDNQLKTSAGLCGLWDGKPISRTRSDGGNIKLYGKRCALHLMVQPKVAALLTSNELLSDQGILSRVLMSMPDSTIGSRMYRPINLNQNRAILKYRSQIEDILKLPLPCAQGTTNLQPRRLTLEGAAKARFELFHNVTEDEAKTGGRYEHIRGFACKAAEHCLRIAGVLELADDPLATGISLSAFERATEIVYYHLMEAVRLHETGMINPDLALAAQVHAWASKYQEIHLQQIYQLGPSKVRSAVESKRIAKILEEHGLFRKVDGKEMDGKFRKDVWRVVHASN